MRPKHNGLPSLVISALRKVIKTKPVWQHQPSALALRRKRSERVFLGWVFFLLIFGFSFAQGRGEDEKPLVKEPRSILLDKHGGGGSFSPDGKSLVSLDMGQGPKDEFGMPQPTGIVKIWDVTSRKSRILVVWGKPVSPAVFSPNGRFLAGETNEMGNNGLESTDRIIVVWKVKTGERVTVLRSDRLVGLAGPIFSPDGKTLLATAASAPLRPRKFLLTFWEIPSGKLRRTIEVDKVDILYDTLLSPDGKIVATAGLARGGEYGKRENNRELPSFLKLWDVATGKELAEYKGLKGPIYSVAFSPDGKLLAIGGNIGKENNEIVLWDIEKKKKYAVLTGHRGIVHKVVFSHDGKLLASAGGSERNGELRLWDVKRLREVARLKEHTDAVTTVSFSPDDSILASSGDGTVRLWQLREPTSAKDKHDR